MIGRLLCIAALTFLALGAPAGCSEFGVVGGECANGLIVCDGQCVNIGESREHCGSCGRACPSNQVCVAGNCRGAPINEQDGSAGGRPSSPNDAGSDAGLPPGFPDGSVLLPDGGVELPDGNIVEPVPCEFPYNSAEHCGACYNECSEQRPFCAPAGDGFECVSGCDEPLVLCDDQCADLESDPANCGRCRNVCPTAICEEGKCVGATPGHVVLMCLTYEQTARSSPQTQLMANALGLANKSPLRILIYEAATPSVAQSGVRRTVRWVEPDAQLTTLAPGSNIGSLLSPDQFDVFIIDDQSQADPGELSSLGAGWREAIDRYFSLGGVIIVLASHQGTAEMQEFIEAASILDSVDSIEDRTFSQLHNRGVSDAMAAGVLSPFLGLETTCVFQTADMPAANFAFVVTDRPASSGEVGSPVVIHRAQAR